MNRWTNRISKTEWKYLLKASALVQTAAPLGVFSTPGIPCFLNTLFMNDQNRLGFGPGLGSHSGDML